MLFETLGGGVALGRIRIVNIDDQWTLTDRLTIGCDEKRHRHHTEDNSPDAEEPQCVTDDQPAPHELDRYQSADFDRH